MKLQMLILASLAFADCQFGSEYDFGQVTSDVKFECPPDQDIKPCQCTTAYEIPAVHCNRIRSLKAMKSALFAKFTVEPIPYLKILDAHFVGLPSRAFMNLSVTRLQIKDTRLRYIHADAFVGLDKLLILVLQNVRLLVFPSASLNQLSSLVKLSLPNNYFSSLEFDDFRGARTLKYLSLAENKFLNLDGASFPSSLVILVLSKNRLSRLNKSITFLSNLEWLFLDDNLLREIEGEFDKLYNLNHLKLNRNRLRKLGNSLKTLRNLKVLELQVNCIKELGDSLKNLNNLKTLNLARNLLIQLSYSNFEGLKSLEILDLSNNKIIASNGAFERLPPSLIGLDLSQNKLKNFSLTELSSLTLLKVLDLNNNQLESAYCKSKSLSLSIIHLLLSNNKLTSLSDFMRYFPYLEDIDVSWNKLNILNLNDFSVSKCINYISVEGNPLICDTEQMMVYLKLMNQNIDVYGRPNCTVEPPFL